MSSSVMNAVAASKLTGLGSSDWTFHPVRPKRNASRADLAASGPCGLRLVGSPEERHLGVPWAVSACLGVGVGYVLPGLCDEDGVAELGGEASRCRAAASHRDEGWRLRQVEDPRVLQREVLALVGVVATRPKQLDDLQGLAEHRVASPNRRPAAADDVLVELLTSP